MKYSIIQYTYTHSFFFLLQDDTIVSPTGVFTRTQSGGVITVKGSNGGNIYPPAPIRDLAIIDIANGKSFNLTFTSPGEDLNTGKISDYKIFYTTNRTQLDSLTPNSNISVVTDDMLMSNCSMEPLPALSKVNLRINSTFFEADSDYSFRVLAMDKDEKTSVSNVVMFAPSFNVPYSGAIGQVGSLTMIILNILVLILVLE